MAYPVVALAVGPLLHRHITVLGGPTKVVMVYIESVKGIFRRMRERQNEGAAEGQEQEQGQGAGEGHVGDKRKAEAASKGKSKGE